MKRKALWVPFLFALLIFASVPVLASGSSTAAPDLPSGNYCASCHSPGDPRLETVTAWNGGIERQAGSPCPAARAIQEEIYYTERLLLAIDRSRAGLPASAELARIDERLAATAQTYHRLLDSPVTSLDAFVSEAQLLRYRLGKSYTQLNQVHEARRSRNVLLAGIAVTLFLLGSLAWGLRNATRGSRRSLRVFHSGFTLPRIVFILVVFVFFALPVFRSVPQEAQAVSAEAQVGQARLDQAQRVADAAGRALSRAWMLGRVGAAWENRDPAQAGEALTAALAAAAEAQEGAAALWGEAQAAQEASGASVASLEKAGLVAGELHSARDRAWHLRLMAAEWAWVDPERSGILLESALETAGQADGAARDLDLRAIAVAWAVTDPQKGFEIAGQVIDPALRSWAFREIAVIAKWPDALQQAVEAAREVEEPVRRSQVLGEAARLADKPELYVEAYSALDGLEGARLAYALAGLAAASGDASLVERIGQDYPSAQVAALLGLGKPVEAWEAASRIADPYEQARAQQTITSAWAGLDARAAVEAARKIAIPALRDRALAEIARVTGDEALVNEVGSVYFQVEALTGLGRFEAAWQAAQQGSLGDPYPLLELATAWAKSDPQSALAVVEKMDREADKAAALRAIAAAVQAQGAGDSLQLFQRALGMALAARVRGDALAPAEASLALAKDFLSLDPTLAAAAFQQAYAAALAISIK